MLKNKMLKNTLIILLLCAMIGIVGIQPSFSSVLGAEQTTFLMDKQLVDNRQNDEYIIHEMKIFSNGNSISRSFDIEVFGDGAYYISAWVMGINGQGDIIAYLNNDTQPVGFLKTTDIGWQNAIIVDDTSNSKQIFLPKGTHNFTFQYNGSEIPQIEYIRLKKQESQVIPSDTKYKEYIETLKIKTLPKDYKKIKDEKQLPAMDDQQCSDSIFMTPTTLSNPKGDYVYAQNIDLNYTYFQIFYFTANQSVVFETKKSNPYASDSVMYLFSNSNPISGGSWSDDDGGDGYQSKISCTIPLTGYYVLLLRAYNSASPGTSDLYKDGSLYASNVALAGKKLYCNDISKSGELNYFTSNLSGDSILYLMSDSSTVGKVRAMNDDYNDSGDFDWRYASRVKKSFSTGIQYVVVSSFSSTSTGYCDVYMKCENSDIASYFPNLKADDAIKSAPRTYYKSGGEGYNCIAWSGGITDDWVWPLEPESPWYDSDPLTAFDNFYGNNPSRYTGAWTYTRNGATYNNAIVDLWALNGEYTHGSVKKPGNGHPHGYDWESKPGDLMRTFHPRDALRGFTYGNIVAHYIRKPGTYALQDLSFEEAEKAGLVMREKVLLSHSEKEKLTKLIKELPVDIRKEFDIKYEAWKVICEDPKLTKFSDLNMYVKSIQYEEFLQYCKKKGKVILPLLFERFEQDDFLAKAPIFDLTLEEHRNILDEIRIESTKEKYTVEGIYIAPSAKANIMKYIKSLLAQIYK